MNVRMVLVPPEKSKERWNCIFCKTKKAILVGIFSSKLPDSSKESGFVDVKMKFRKSFVVTNGIDKPIILDFHKFGQSSHFGTYRLAIRKKENQCKQSDSFTKLYVGTGQKENPYPFTNGNSYDVKYHMDDLNASGNGQENTIRRIQSAGKRDYMEFWK